MTTTPETLLGTPVSATPTRAVNVWRRLLARPSAVIGLFILFVFVMIAILSPFITPHDPLKIFPGERLSAPSLDFLMGTDQIGRDILSRLLAGARISIIVGVGAVALGAAVGGVSGLIAGYFGGWVDAVTMRIWDALFAFPVVLVGIGLVSALGPGTETTILAVGIGTMPTFARIARASALHESHKEYVEGVRSIGGRHERILLLHIVPNAVGPLLVQVAMAMSAAVLIEASLSFLGLGAQPPMSSWGNMLSESRAYLLEAPAYSIFPGLAITLLVIALNLIADGLRDAFDVRGRR